MFTMKELELYLEMSVTKEINGITFTLTKVEELSGLHAVWVSESYNVYATPYFENIPVLVHVIDCNNQEIGTEDYSSEIDDFD